MPFGTAPPNLLQYAGATGNFVCARCGNLLFAASKQFHAGCGFPSFWTQQGNGVTQKQLDTYGRSRLQLVCSRCGLHLGHLFANRYTPTGLRYCINAAAICLEKDTHYNDIQENNRHMPLANEHFEELKAFIRQHRSNESNFDQLAKKLEEEISTAKSDPQMRDYAASLEAIGAKQVTAYHPAKESTGSAWPEFEQFVSEWEKAIAAAQKAPEKDELPADSH